MKGGLGGRSEEKRPLWINFFSDRPYNAEGRSSVNHLEVGMPSRDALGGSETSFSPAISFKGSNTVRVQSANDVI